MASVCQTSMQKSSSTEEPLEHEEKAGDFYEGETKAKVNDSPKSANPPSFHDKMKKTREVFAELKNAVIASTKALQTEFTQLKAKEERFYELSRKISSVNFESAITLNVGGNIYQTSLETLTKHSGSLLAEMFSASFDLKQGTDGSYFIDRDGTHFRHILNYLRSGNAPVPSILKADSEEILIEAQYYGLVGLVQAIKDKLNGDDEKSDESIQEEDGNAGDCLVEERRKELYATEEKLNSFLSLLDADIKVLDEATLRHKEVSMELSDVHFGENIKLDVGGRIFKTSLKTLRKEPQSFLALMFSERFDLKKEDDGSYFIDYDGTYFHHILNYLRDGKIADDVIKVHGSQMQKEAEFYKLSGLKEQIHNYNNLRLNVGGRDFVATREILKKHPESMFGKMLAGEEGDYVKRNDGSYFIQHDGTNFHHILEYIQAGTISDDVISKCGEQLRFDAKFYMLPGIGDRISNYYYIKLDIGGTHFVVLREKLIRFPKSMFGKMLVGEKGDYLKRKDGSYYIWRDPTLFGYIWKHISAEVAGSTIITPDKDSCKKLKVECSYYGLHCRVLTQQESHYYSYH